MSKTMAVTTAVGGVATAGIPVDWHTALDTFLNNLSSPRMEKAYERAVTEAMGAMGVDFG